MLKWEIQQAVFKPDYSIEVQFADGLTGVVKVQKSRLIRVFARLTDIKLFLRAVIKYGAITSNIGEYELDLAPETMYREIKSNNEVYILK